VIGIWTTGDFVPSFQNGNVIEYSGTGDSSASWSEDLASACAENFVPGNPATLEFNVFPNPSVGEINIDFENQVTGSATVRVLNINGTVEKELVVTAEDQIDIMIDNLPSGTYYLRVSNKNFVSIKQFIVIE